MDYKLKDIVVFKRDIRVLGSDEIVKRGSFAVITNIQTYNYLVLDQDNKEIIVNDMDIEFVERKAKEKGKCSICGSENLAYGVVELVDEQLYYPYYCNDCFSSGKEWYSLHYIETVGKI